MEVARGIHLQTLGIVNWYLVEDGGRLTIIDSGAPADWSLLLRALGSLGRTLDDVEAVLLTHAHSDHTGFAERARTEAGAAVWAHELEAARARGGPPAPNERGFGPYLVRPQAYATAFSLLRRGGARRIPVAEVRTFEDGESVDVPGRPRAVHMPGHTEGSAALWFADRAAVCAGDALVTWNPMTGRRGPQVMPAVFNVDSTQALASLAALEPLGDSLLLPGHGEPWEGAAEAVHLARQAGRS